MKQWLNTKGYKTRKKDLGSKIWAKQTKIGPETMFFAIFPSFGLLVFIEIIYSDSLQQCLTFSTGKSHEK